MLEASVVRGLVHVLDVGLEDEQVGSRGPKLLPMGIRRDRTVCRKCLGGSPDKIGGVGALRSCCSRVSALTSNP